MESSKIARLEAEIEKLRKEVARQRQRLENDYQTIIGLSSGYDVLHLLNLETERYIPYFVENIVQDVSDADYLDYFDFPSAHRAYMEACCHPDYLEKMLKYSDYSLIKKVLRGKKRHHERIQIKNSDGSYSWVDWVLIKSEPIDKEAVNIAIAFIGVDDEVKAEMDRMNAIEAARLSEEAQKERYNFLVNVSHELRTPLTLVIGPLRRVLRKDPITDSTRGIIERVCQQADRMTTLLNTVLTTNKIEEGADRAHPEPVIFNDWVRKSADEFRDEAANHDIRINVFTDPSIAAVPIDEHLCKIVFANLMINAIRYTFSNTSIDVSTAWTESKDAVRVSVRDYGSGIGDIDVSKLFERYYRATEEETGFGIGLSYSKAIIDAHKGRIGAFNNPGGSGATFWFELPADYESRIQTAVAAAPVEAPVFQEPKKLADKVLLYVEDDYDLRSYVKNEVEDVCAKVLTACNGMKALDVLASNQVDIVLTDVMMPELDGIKLCHILKTSEKFRDIPVIMLSAKADETSKARGYDVKADYYLDKPFVLEQLLDILEKKIK